MTFFWSWVLILEYTSDSARKTLPLCGLDEVQRLIPGKCCLQICQSQRGDAWET